LRRLWKTRRRQLWLACFVALLFYYLIAEAAPQRRVANPVWLPELAARTTPTRTVAVLGQAVHALSRRRVNVYCWSSEDWARKAEAWPSDELGPLTPWRSYTSPETANVELAPNVCTELERLRGRAEPIWKSSDRRAAAWTVESVAHESVHVSGIHDEAKAECYGMQHVPLAAVYLGLTPKEGRFLARLYWRDWYPRAPLRYRSRECRDGGALDRHPRSSRWP
jgi:hypothetical protein